MAAAPARKRPSSGDGTVISLSPVVEPIGPEPVLEAKSHNPQKGTRKVAKRAPRRYAADRGMKQQAFEWPPELLEEAKRAQCLRPALGDPDLTTLNKYVIRAVEEFNKRTLSQYAHLTELLKQASNNDNPEIETNDSPKNVGKVPTT